MFFAETAGSFETKFGIKAYGCTSMNIYANEFGHTIKMAAMPIYSKNIKKSSSHEPVD